MLYTVQEQRVILHALEIIGRQLNEPRGDISHTSPKLVVDYLRLQLENQERELFIVLLFNTHLQLLDSQVMFMGTVNSVDVHPREIARYALQHNAHCVILAHNHPSGVAEPSQADIHITRLVKEALNLLDIRVC